MLLLDLDDFKPINDRYGHAAGDEVLRAVSQRMVDCVRGGDLVARLGGDEFAIILQEPSSAGTEAVAQRIVAAIGEPVPVDGRPLTVGVSVGVARCAPAGDDLDGLLGRADAAMYEAKAAGKNAVHLHPSHPG